MAQVNKYADRAAYVADKNRLSTKSAISYIESESATVYDGVNVLVDKSSASIGDLVVWDKTAGVVRFIKSATIVKAQIPATLVPLAVVYGRWGDRVRIVSLDNATYNGSASILWAASYEVALSGFNLAAGGEFKLHFYETYHTFTYSAGTTLAQIAAQINADAMVVGTYGWCASVDGVNSCIIMLSNTWAPSYVIIDVVSGCTIRRTPDDKAYQTTLTGKLFSGVRDPILRKNTSISEIAGCSLDKFTRAYSTSGSNKTDQPLGSYNIIRESVFTKEANPGLVAAYPTYKDYLSGEHMVRYPSAFGALLRDGKTDTALIGRLQFVDIRGKSAICYPAAFAALNYGVVVDGAATGLEPGAWWLPSVDEMYVLMHDRVITSAEVDSDPVGRTLSLLGKSTLYAGNYAMYTSSEYQMNGAFCYYGYDGTISCQACKYTLCYVRPVSIL